MGTKNNNAEVAAMNKAIEEQKKARARLDAVEQPDYSEIEDYIRAAAAENPELLGLYEAIERDPSAIESIVGDSSLRETQVDALESLKEAGESGFAAEDMAQRREIQRDAASSDKARQSSILQQMAERGQSGAGAELAARLASSQQTAQRAAEAGDRLATDSAAARRQAVQQAAQAATGLRQQDRSEAVQTASAQDQIAQFNALNRQNTNNQNLQLRQGMENQRTGQNQQMYSNLGNLQQQKFGNEMQQAGAYVNATQPIANMTAQNVSRSQGPLGTIGTLAGAGIGAYFGGTQGAAVGGQLGGALGNSAQSNSSGNFADGGLKGSDRSYDEIMRDKKLNLEMDRVMNHGGDRVSQAFSNSTKNISTGEALSAGKQKLRSIGNSLSNLLPSMGGSQEAPQPELKSTPELSKDQIDMSRLSQVAQGLNSPKQERSLDLQSSPVIDSSSLGKLAQNRLIAANGGIKEDETISKPEMEGVDYPYKGREELEEILDKNPDKYEEISDKLEEAGDKYSCGGAKKMAYNDGGMGTIIESGEESYAGDRLEDRINDGEMVLNLEQQDRINDKLMELKRLKSQLRTDTMVDEGNMDVNESQQQSLLSVARGEKDVEELPNDRIVKEPTGSVGELLQLLRKRK